MDDVLSCLYLEHELNDRHSRGCRGFCMWLTLWHDDLLRTLCPTGHKQEDICQRRLNPEDLLLVFSPLKTRLGPQPYSVVFLSLTNSFLESTSFTRNKQARIDMAQTPAFPPAQRKKVLKVLFISLLLDLVSLMISFSQILILTRHRSRSPLFFHSFPNSLSSTEQQTRL